MITKSGKAICPIALGTMYFGTRISEEQGRELLDTFLAMGGNQIDTARSYASWIPDGMGASESALGRLIKRYSREEIFLGTKGGLMPRGYNETRGELGREHIEKELSESLEALGTDYIDLYWLHRDDFRYTPGQIVEEMNRLIDAGRIRYYGVSNWTADRIREANDYAAKHGLEPVAASQIQYGLGYCTRGSWGDPTVICMDSQQFQAYEEMQLPVYGYSAQAEGYFPIYIKGGTEALSPDTRHKYDLPENQRRAEVLRKLMQEKPLSLSWVMAEYVLESPFPAVFILGGSNLDRMKEIMANYSQGIRQLTDQDWARIGALR